MFKVVFALNAFMKWLPKTILRIDITELDKTDGLVCGHVLI